MQASLAGAGGGVWGGGIYIISQQRQEVQIFIGKLSFFYMWKLFQNLITQETTEQTKQSADTITYLCLPYYRVSKDPSGSIILCLKIVGQYGF